MSYDEEQHKRSRVVVETPTARREVVQQQTVRYPERRNFSTGMVVTVALVAIAATAIVFLFLTNSRNDSTETNVNMRAAAVPQPTPFAQQPVTVPMTAPTPQTVVIQQAPPTTTATPLVIIQQQPATTAPAQTTAPAAAPPAHDDASLQAKLDKAFGDDPQISAANINATVVNGRVTLIGMVPSDAVKARAESMAYKIKGVLGVDNKLVVSSSTP